MAPLGRGEARTGLGEAGLRPSPCMLVSGLPSVSTRQEPGPEVAAGLFINHSLGTKKEISQRSQERPQSWQVSSGRGTSCWLGWDGVSRGPGSLPLA